MVDLRFIMVNAVFQDDTFGTIQMQINLCISQLIFQTPFQKEHGHEFIAYATHVLMMKSFEPHHCVGKVYEPTFEIWVTSHDMYVSDVSDARMSHAKRATKEQGTRPHPATATLPKHHRSQVVRSSASRASDIVATT